MKSETHSNGGYWLVTGLALLLLLPPVIGHFVMQPAPAPTVHADASQQ